MPFPDGRDTLMTLVLKKLTHLAMVYEYKGATILHSSKDQLIWDGPLSLCLACMEAGGKWGEGEKGGTCLYKVI